MTLDIETIVPGYAIDRGQRCHLYLRPLTQEEENAGLTDCNVDLIDIPKTVRDARGLGLKLDDTSFELVPGAATSLATEDFYDHDTIVSRYYPEIAAVIQRHTGAAQVHVLSHQVRNSAATNPKGDASQPVNEFALGVHSDTSAYSAEDRFKALVATDEFAKFKKGRFLYVNAWRSISDDGPVRDHPLAVCDERTVVKPDDYLSTDMYIPNYKIVQTRLAHRHHHLHKWYYYPNMEKSEVLLKKLWDSDPTKPGRLNFHTAIEDPNSPAGTSTRQSIEARCMAFFPDHEPNTCPELE